MIGVHEAKKIIYSNTTKLESELIPLNEALGRVLFEDVWAKIDTPPFKQAAMDGYAFNTENTSPELGVPLSGLSEAGNTQLHELVPGTTQRIFTGAPVPLGANTVIMQEKVQIKNNLVWVEPIDFLPHLNIREQGSQLAKDNLAVPANTRLHAGIISFLAGMGYTEITVYKQPKIGLLISGKELIPPGNPLLFGQIYESNSILLQTALLEGRIEVYRQLIIGDDWQETKEAISLLLQQCDLILATGGISVGDFDFVGKAMLENGVEPLFYKVKQKPGKPLFYGKKDTVQVFALPGNPGSVLSCFYQFVIPCIRQMTGLNPPIWRQATLKSDVTKKTGLTHYLKGFAKDSEVQILEAQESYKLNAFVSANCLVEIKEEQNFIAKGEVVNLFYFHEAWV
jgi:molybdopterin molybdotransferase